MTIQTIQGPWKILRRGALLGPNASGKSNFIQSLAFAREYIVEAQKSGMKTGIPYYIRLDGQLTYNFLQCILAAYGSLPCYKFVFPCAYSMLFLSIP